MLLRAALLVSLLSTLEACQCLVPVEEHRSDAGLDVGAHRADGGSHDAGLEDAGARDAGVLDAGPLDAGPSDSGASPERCDGLDNDLDGRIDTQPDGGPLAALCPLTQGVCASARSLCVDGGYAPCDYGTDFQRVESRCDGLDNDCDGRVDRSRPQVLLTVDAGRRSFQANRLLYLEVTPAQVLDVGSALLVNLPTRTLWLNRDLEVQRDATLPEEFTTVSVLLRDGDGFMRFGVTSTPGACLFAHRLEADGGVPLQSDGGLAYLATVCDQRTQANLFVLPDGPDRWVAASGFFAQFSPMFSGGDAVAVTFSRDGGTSLAIHDGGPSNGNAIALDGGFGVVWETSGSSRSEWCDSALHCTTRFTTPYPACRVVSPAQDLACTLAPMTLSWLDATGAPLHSPVSGAANINRQLLAASPRIFVALDASPFPGAAPPFWASTTLATVTAAGVTPFETLEGQRFPDAIRVDPLDEHLHLVLWADGSGRGFNSLLNAIAEQLNAEYVCLP